jgi:hypothetical protein
MLVLSLPDHLPLLNNMSLLVRREGLMGRLLTGNKPEYLPEV